MQESQSEIMRLNREFQQEIGMQSNGGSTVHLTRQEYDSLPNNEYFRRKFPFP